MDPLTHGALGAALGHTCFRGRLGVKVLAVGAVAAMLPDLDLIYGSLQGPFGRLLSHRGFTHSIFFAPLAGSLLGWLAWRRARRRDPDGAGPLPWILLCLIAMWSHPLLDLCTTYGTQLLAPFSRARFALNAIPIVDPVYSALLAAGIAGGLLCGDRKWTGWVTGSALILSTIYLAIGLRVNVIAEAEARNQLRAAGIRQADIHVFPTMLQLPHRRLVALTPAQARVGFISMWRPCPVRWGVADRIVDADVQTLASTREGRIFEWFASGLLIPRFSIDNGQRVVEFMDLRYGFEPDPLRSLWGMRGRFDATGALVAVPERFDERPEVTGAAIRQLFSDAYPSRCEESPE